MAKAPAAFRTISEVANWLGTQAHVLRFWESKFDQIAPVKRAGGRRYYRPEDMMLIGGIKKLLHDDGMTIKGVQKLIADKGVDHVSKLSSELVFEDKIKTKRKSKKGDATAKSAPVEPAPNVIAFTVDPLPVRRSIQRKKAKFNEDQPLLFPEMAEWDAPTEPVTSIAPPSVPPTPADSTVDPFESELQETMFPAFRTVHNTASVEQDVIEENPIISFGADLGQDDAAISTFDTQSLGFSNIISLADHKRTVLSIQNPQVIEELSSLLQMMSSK